MERDKKKKKRKKKVLFGSLSLKTTGDEIDTKMQSKKLIRLNIKHT